MLPTVGEPADGILTDICALVAEPSHLVRGIENASAEPVPDRTAASSSCWPPTRRYTPRSCSCQRAAKRATTGLARVGSNAHNPSADIFLALGTGNEIPAQTVTAKERQVKSWQPKVRDVELVDDQTINGIFEAAAEAAEEGIYNALYMAETMTGKAGRRLRLCLPIGYFGLNRYIENIRRNAHALRVIG